MPEGGTRSVMSHRHAVLIVDDHADGLEAMQFLVEAHGFDVVSVRRAEEALARLRMGLGCCLVILDWRMPSMTGGQLHQALSTDVRLCKIPLLVVTGDPHAAAEARALGIRHVQLKPIEPSVLVEIIGEHCTSSAA